MYHYRCTEQQLEEHLQRVVDAGDQVLTVIYKGGRDYLLVCQHPEPSILTITPQELEDLIKRAVIAGVKAGVRRDRGFGGGQSIGAMKS